jgi:hypothetical protein
MSDNLPTSGQAPAASRFTWLIIVGSMVAAVPLYGIIGWIILNGATPSETPDTPVAHELVWALRAGAVVLLLASALSLRLLPRTIVADPASPGGEVEPPPSFINRSIVSMAIAGACAIFLRRAPYEYPWYAAGSLLVQLALVIPSGMRAWDAWEQRARGI